MSLPGAGSANGRDGLSYHPARASANVNVNMNDESIELRNEICRERDREVASECECDSND